MTPGIVWWVVGILITVLLTVIGSLFTLFINHMNECRAFREVVIRIDANVNRIMRDLGTHETGIRGQLNQHNEMLAEHRFRLNALDKLIATK